MSKLDKFLIFLQKQKDYDEKNKKDEEKTKKDLEAKIKETNDVININHNIITNEFLTKVNEIDSFIFNHFLNNPLIGKMLNDEMINLINNDFDQKQFDELYSRGTSLNLAILESIKVGKLEIIKYVMSSFKTQNVKMCELYLFEAAKIGYKGIVDYFLSINDEFSEQGLQGAASGGNISLIDFFISKGAKDLNSALFYASQYGQLISVKYLIETCKADNISYVLKGLTFSDNIEIKKYIDELIIEY